MKRIVLNFLVILVVIPLLAGFSEPKGKLTLKTIQCGQEERSYYEYIPTRYQRTHPVPLLIMLHGAGGSGSQCDSMTEWSTLAEKNNFIVVYPNGHQWWIAYEWGDYNFDEQFILALIKKMEANYKIDRQRIYMSGHSHGASMTITFAFKHAEMLAAIAIASPAWMQADPMYNIDPYQIAQPKRTIPIYIWRGALETWPSAAENNLMLKYWLDFNQTQKNQKVIKKGIYTTSIYSSPKGEVRYTEIAERGHNSYDPDTSAKIWYDFFVYQKRK